MKSYDSNDDRLEAMIDSYSQVVELMRKLEADLPRPDRLTGAVVRSLRKTGMKIALNQAPEIKRLFYHGDESGIV